MMLGGVIGGYCASGKLSTATPPARVITSDSTAAMIGRSMKKCENITAPRQASRPGNPRFSVFDGVRPRHSLAPAHRPRLSDPGPLRPGAGLPLADGGHEPAQGRVRLLRRVLRLDLDLDLRPH